ncbi:MAG: peptidylprolyl isomerase [Candidatus Scalindua sediminis]|nr:peptidylprolyl isomerase [Candidatus Scalindua sediminis]
MFRKTLLIIICSLFVFQFKGLLLANEKTKTEPKTEESTRAVAEVKTEKKTGGEKEVEKKGEDIVATVNGEKVFRKDLDRRLSVLKRMNQEVTRSTQMLVVNQLTKKVLLKQFVEGQNIEVSNEEIQGEVEKIKFFLKSGPNNSEKPLEEILESRGSSISELEAEVTRTLALSKYLDKEVSDDEKRSYFDANKNAFNGERVRASHVLIDTRKMKTDAELEGAKQKIGDIKKEIDNGADFAEMAKKYSDCPSAEKGGDIDFFQRKGSMVEEFAKVAFSMEVGEVSEPVKTPFGYHIIKVTDREEGKDVSYEDVSDMVDFVYMQIKTETLLEGLIEKAEIEVFL